MERRSGQDRRNQCEHQWVYSEPNTSGAIFQVCIKCRYIGLPIYGCGHESTTNARPIL